MTPAPETGRTADENEMRAQVRKAIVAAMPENIPLRGRMARSIMASVINPLLSEVAHLRAENANLRDRVREAEGAGVASRLWGKSHAQLAEEIRGAKLPGQAEGLVARLIEDARAFERDAMRVQKIREAGDA